MAKSKKVQMPAGIRNKLMAAVAMLLVSSIMMVSSTYAWFTLSTAPEVTGITTSVGANGNLEMALLTTETYDNLSNIASAVGNSSAATGDVAGANITWGNLIDLSEATYGLHAISLQPSRLNFLATKDGENVDYKEDELASANGPLMIPTYGKDGRVSELKAETYSTVYSANGTWAFVPDSQTYGVRAIGANDNLSPQQAGLMNAKSNYNSNLKSAKSAVQSALSANGNALASAITALAMDSEATLVDDQITAIGAMITASSSALNYIDAAYKQVLLAAASEIADATAYENAANAINSAASYAEALTNLTALSSDSQIAVPTELSDAIDELNSQRTIVSGAQANYNLQTNAGYKAALTALVDTNKVSINGFGAGEIMVGDDVNSAFTQAVLDNGGAIVEMPDGSGVFAYVGSVAGNYSANCKVSLTQPVKMTANATMKTTATVDSTIGTAINAVEPAASSGGSSVLSDLYGYALDFAFRTNAADSYLELQTEGVQRVYGDSTSAATQGAGSTMTFKATTTDAGAATLTNDQVKSLMNAIRVAFIDPQSAKVYGIAALSDITESSDGFTGALYLQDYTVATNGALAVNGAKVDTDTSDNKDANAIMKLDQSQIARLTVIVYLDGDLVDNSDVANAANSLVGSMNLQFSSSAELVPMQNTALHNMTITYTELTTNDYKLGLHNFNDTLYKLNTGYKVYQGSDNMVYFSNDETNYTKLTVMNVSTVMTPVTVVGTIENNGVIEVDEGADLKLETASGATIKSVGWTLNPESGVISVNPGSGDAINTAVVTGTAVGTAKITAAVTLEFTADGATALEVPVNVEFNVTVKNATYTVSFNANGGTGTMSAVTGVSGEYTLPVNGFTAPENKQFKGWATASDGTVITDATVEVTADTELFAIWEDVTTSGGDTSDTGDTGSDTGDAS